MKITAILKTHLFARIYAAKKLGPWGASREKTLDHLRKNMPETVGQQQKRFLAPRYLGLFIWVFLFSAFVNILLLTGPLFMIQVYDRVLGAHSVETLSALFILMTALFLLLGLLDYSRARLLARIGAQARLILDPTAFTREMRARCSTDTDDISLVTDVDTVQKFLASPAILALFDLPWSPLFFTVLFSLHPFIGWFSVFGGGCLVAIAFFRSFLTKGRQKTSQDLTRVENEFYTQVRSGANYLHAQGVFETMQLRWLDFRKRALHEIVAVNDVAIAFSSATRALRLFLQSSMLALGAWLVIQGQLAASTMIVSSILMGRALAPVEQLISQWPLIHQARRAWENLKRLTGPNNETTEFTRLPRPVSSLEVRNLTILSPDRTTRLVNNVGFRLGPGQVLGVIGESGSGKSTLAKALAGTTGIVHGDVILGKASYQQYDPEDLGRYIGYLPQEFTLFQGTIAENIARMAQEFDDKAVVAAAQRANAHEFILSLPQGYSTPLFFANKRLSGGEKQRVALARALFGDPLVLVLDEPNSALDTQGMQALNSTVREWRSKGRSVVIMTHRPTAVSECTFLLILDKGNVRAFGPRDEVLSKYIENSRNIRAMIRTVGS